MHVRVPPLCDATLYRRSVLHLGYKCGPTTLSDGRNGSIRCTPARVGFWTLEASMDETDQLKTTTVSPSTDDDHDALAKRWRENWASPAPGPLRTGGHVLQQLRHGRIRVVAVENVRSRRRPMSL